MTGQGCTDRDHRDCAKLINARIANCLAAIGIGSIAQIREKVGFEGIGWIDKIPALGEKSKTRILKSIGYDYKKLTPVDKAILLLESNGYAVTKV